MHIFLLNALLYPIKIMLIAFFTIFTTIIFSLFIFIYFSSINQQIKPSIGCEKCNITMKHTNLCNLNKIMTNITNEIAYNQKILHQIVPKQKSYTLRNYTKNQTNKYGVSKS